MFYHYFFMWEGFVQLLPPLPILNLLCCIECYLKRNEVTSFPFVKMMLFCRIFQKVAETGTAGGRSETAAAGPRSKFGILLETIHKEYTQVLF